MNKRSLAIKIKNEYLGKTYTTICGLFIIVLTISIIFFIASKGLSTFIKDGHSVYEFVFSSTWNMSEIDADSKFGALIFIMGSTIIATGAVLISTPLGISLAIFINMISPKLGEKLIQPSMELFVGIPSVVYGWIGVSVLVPVMKNIFGDSGKSALAGIIVLSVMILPTITSIASDAIKTIPKDYIEASYGLGATRWQTIIRVIIPAAKNGISTGVVLGLARAFGESLAVQMVIGNSISFPNGISGTTSTLTSYLTMNMGDSVDKTPNSDALWSMALLLLVISFLFILVIRVISKKGEIK